jgi:two-component system, NtrC family, nitrogen regulation sensor histidine kinase NtrY
VFAGMFGSRMAGPLRRLVVHTERLARGDYDARVVVDSRDEVAILADALNRLAAELKESNRRLVEAEKNAAWKEMARQVAHEIKNPLTPIMLSAQQLERAHKDRHPRFDEILVESTRSIVEQCASLRSIAQNFAGFASFPQSRREPLAFGRLVRDAARLYAPKRDDGPGVVVKVDVPENVRILGDEDELRRVFLNLFNNAFEATGAEGALTIEAKVVGVGADAKAVAAVRDTGRGIPPEDKSRLFEPYFSTRTGGTGLGLAICRKIVSEHRGTIVCESAVGVGTTFVLTFPILKDDGSGADARPPDPFGETKTVVRT